MKNCVKPIRIVKENELVPLTRAEHNVMLDFCINPIDGEDSDPGRWWTPRNTAHLIKQIKQKCASK